MEIKSLHYDLPQTLNAYRPPAAVVAPYLHAAQDTGIKDILMAWPRTVFVDLAFEQVLQKIDYEIKAPRDKFAQEEALHVVWSEQFKEFLEGYGSPEENVIVNGNPVYELYRPPYNGYFPPRQQLANDFNLDSSKRWIFIPENFGAAFFPESRIKKYMKLGTSETDIRNYKHFATESLQWTAQWLKKAGEENDVEIIVRPRPSTPKADFERFCREAAGAFPPNIHIIKDGTVREWIIASDLVGSSYSTTLIEAAVAQREIFMLAPVPFPAFMHNDWFGMVPHVRSYGDLLSVINNPASQDNWKPLHNWAVSTMLGKGDVFINLANLLARIYHHDEIIPRRVYRRKHLVGVTEASLLYRSKRFLSRLRDHVSGRVTTAEKRTVKNPRDLEADRFETEDVESSVERWRLVLQ
ncbi:MAG: hypothetical protein HFACDABA_02020 [Anaerolineales bacterium]|nr:hypothetical protein [Anaerolineales bacterium]